MGRNGDMLWNKLQWKVVSSSRQLINAIYSVKYMYANLTTIFMMLSIPVADCYVQGNICYKYHYSHVFATF